MGARLVLELARPRGVLGAVVSLDPGDFWSGWQQHFFYVSIAMSIRLVRLLQPILPVLTRSVVGRALLLAPFSAQPSKLSPGSSLRNCAASLPPRHMTKSCANSLTERLKKVRGKARSKSARDRLGPQRSHLSSRSSAPRRAVISRRAVALIRKLRTFPSVGCRIGDGRFSIAPDAKTFQR